jgi:hypothetical protein
MQVLKCQRFLERVIGCLNESFLIMGHPDLTEFESDRFCKLIAGKRSSIEEN